MTGGRAEIARERDGTAGRPSKALTLSAVRSRCFPFDARRVAPQVFQGVEIASVAMENMHDHLQVIEHHPLTGGKTIDRDWPHRVIGLQPRFDFVGDCFELRFGTGGANHKKIGERGNPAQIEKHDVFGLLIGGEFGAGLG
jgi:hypothetical protein